MVRRIVANTATERRVSVWLLRAARKYPIGDRHRALVDLALYFLREVQAVENAKRRIYLRAYNLEWQKRKYWQAQERVKKVRQSFGVIPSPDHFQFANTQHMLAPVRERHATAPVRADYRSDKVVANEPQS